MFTCLFLASGIVFVINSSNTTEQRGVVAEHDAKSPEIALSNAIPSPPRKDDITLQTNAPKALPLTEAENPKTVDGDIYLTKEDGSALIPSDSPIYVLRTFIPRQMYATEMTECKRILANEMSNSMWGLPGMGKHQRSQQEFFEGLKNDLDASLAVEQAGTINVVQELGLSAMQKYSTLRITGSATNQYTPAEFSEHAMLAEDKLLPSVMSRCTISMTRTDRAGHFSFQLPDDVDDCAIVSIFQNSVSITICTKQLTFFEHHHQNVSLNSADALLVAHRIER